MPPVNKALKRGTVFRQTGLSQHRALRLPDPPPALSVSLPEKATAPMPQSLSSWASSSSWFQQRSLALGKRLTVREVQGKKLGLAPGNNTQVRISGRSPTKGLLTPPVAERSNHQVHQLGPNHKSHPLGFIWLCLSVCPCSRGEPGVLTGDGAHHHVEGLPEDHALGDCHSGRWRLCSGFWQQGTTWILFLLGQIFFQQLYLVSHYDSGKEYSKALRHRWMLTQVTGKESHTARNG